MKKNILHLGLSLLFAGSVASGCEDKWDAHYDSRPINSTEVLIYEGKVENYLQTTEELSTLNAMMKDYGVMEKLASRNQQYTLLVYTNEALASAVIEDSLYFLNTCISDVALAPNKLSDGLQILMWNKKALEVKVTETETKSEAIQTITIGGSAVVEVIQSENGFIYIMDNPIYAPKSLYEYLISLGEEYSIFREMVLSYEENIFDKDASTPKGIDETGNTIYDTVYTAKNTFYDRYTSRQHTTKAWDMYSEFYSSTMLIPSNEVLTEARVNAYNNVQAALGHTPNADDSTRIEEWLLGAFFYSSKLTAEQMSGTEDLYGIASFKEDESVATEGSQWRPTVQEVDVNNPIELSNGIAYRITKMKVPNNIIIWRIKSRFYQVWDACDSTQKADYFNYINLDSTRQTKDNGGFGGWDIKTPYIEYTLIRAQPNAQILSLANSVDTVVPAGLIATGCLYSGGKVEIARIPAGEYNLSMGFALNCKPWKLDITLVTDENEQLVKTAFDPSSTNYDRYGDKLYAYGFDPIAYYEQSGGKAENYDRDGSFVGTVTIGTGKGDTNLYSFKLKMLDPTGYLAKGSIFYAYHWCLRPTANNY